MSVDTQDSHFSTFSGDRRFQSAGHLVEAGQLDQVTRRIVEHHPSRSGVFLDAPRQLAASRSSTAKATMGKRVGAGWGVPLIPTVGAGLAPAPGRPLGRPQKPPYPEGSCALGTRTEPVRYRQLGRWVRKCAITVRTSARLLTPSLDRMLLTCVFAVSRVIVSSAAICGLV